MKLARPFRCQQFTVQQKDTVMKVGTDGFVLGAVAPVSYKPRSILEIGSGTGLISLMLAQRSQADQIDAVEIQEDAYELSVTNFENSPWSDRLFCYHASFQEFIEEIDDTYDLVISNPPFFTSGIKSPSNHRNTERFTDTLPFETICRGAVKLLSGEGILCLIFPYDQFDSFTSTALSQNLHLRHVIRIQGQPANVANRVICCYGFQPEPDPIQDNFTIRNEDGTYTEQYKEATREFHLSPENL